MQLQRVADEEGSAAAPPPVLPLRHVELNPPSAADTATLTRLEGFYRPYNQLLFRLLGRSFPW